MTPPNVFVPFCKYAIFSYHYINSAILSCHYSVNSAIALHTGIFFGLRFSAQGRNTSRVPISTISKSTRKVWRCNSGSFSGLTFSVRMVKSRLVNSYLL